MSIAPIEPSAPVLAPASSCMIRTRNCSSSGVNDVKSIAVRHSIAKNCVHKFRTVQGGWKFRSVCSIPLSMPPRI
ncbi:hypothetical protein PF007_g16899 [Phytophthora fragariae]|uniref:Uncharacterized protein n=1 Tax=Phytophthora fragariae TaxID=53985 RepID=A0A6A3RG58_9STRA|nr:hypothetical protein PF007_g16899 [Phytophthora fragariae]